MTGPEHYQASERAIISAGEAEGTDRFYFLQVAQVHATLALAAAEINSRFPAQTGAGPQAWAQSMRREGS